MVLEEGNMEEILNWESAKFYPQYWIASKLICSTDFYLKSTKRTKKETWRNFLKSMLKKKSFEPA